MGKCNKVPINHNPAAHFLGSVLECRHIYEYVMAGGRRSDCDICDRTVDNRSRELKPFETDTVVIFNNINIKIFD